MPPTLRSERLLLRPIVSEDAAALVELDSDPEVMRHITGGKPASADEVTLNGLPRMLEVNGGGAPNGYWAACDGSGAFLGWFHLKPAHWWPNELEIGYRLARRAWGKGLAVEGAQTLVAYAFAHGAERVVAATMAGNAPSRRVLEKLGMSFVCEFEEPRWPGADRRAVKYEIRRGAAPHSAGAPSSQGA